jgi:hypothetical protein
MKIRYGKIFNTKGFEAAYKFIKKERIKLRIENKIRRTLKLNVKEVKPRKKVNTKEDSYYQQYENIDKKDSKVVLLKSILISMNVWVAQLVTINA